MPQRNTLRPALSKPRYSTHDRHAIFSGQSFPFLVHSPHNRKSLNLLSYFLPGIPGASHSPRRVTPQNPPEGANGEGGWGSIRNSPCQEERAHVIVQLQTPHRQYPTPDKCCAHIPLHAAMVPSAISRSSTQMACHCRCLP